MTLNLYDAYHSLSEHRALFDPSLYHYINPV